MALRIEDYALIGDCHTAALVGRDGSIDWLCLPRFDSGACFAALLGTEENGRWKIAPTGPVTATRRRYLGDTLVLETEFETADGVVAVIDFMPVRVARPDLVRIVEGRRGTVSVSSELVIRFDYGSIVPWVQKNDGGVNAVAGANALHLRSPVATHGEGRATVAEFTVQEGQRVPFVLTWHRSFDPEPPPLEPEEALRDTRAWWEEWAGRCTYRGERRDLVIRSLVALKAMTYAPSGGIVAAPTASLPEWIGGPRNWDYRFCWLRDATFTLLAFLNAGFVEEALAWREWVLRAAAGDPSKLQIMYGVGGERRLEEYEVPWLTGYEKSAPVRIGNAAHAQFQLDVYGELADAMLHARRAGLKPAPGGAGWALERALVDFVVKAWDQPDEGIWETRGPRRHFTHSKVMAWVALDRAITVAEQYGRDAPLDQWKAVRAAIHERVCRDGFDPQLNSFVQYFGSDRLDAALLMIPIVGFLPPDDPRVRGTIAAVEARLLRDGFVSRYEAPHGADGPPQEGSFLACSFWLADCYALTGEREKAHALFDQLAGLCNDVGLLSEQYDPAAKRQLGNFPQAFSHVGLVNTALNLFRPTNCPAQQRQNA
ncbi:glycoside hydrolase family 15 protein [Frigoriglobus tundricola]|uniref:Glucoamylase, GH15 family n=1 Tax=Frigoriglobus tundricola TaxID=2774151 RepID=A0A6M5YXZ6_9BACT|nr:glycoside hydrolase family 15 protein [Frigoriglobus tundricola]QJW98875.1 Glucoamylase, GH15 family [Frigoriglobus tundricola]